MKSNKIFNIGSIKIVNAPIADNTCRYGRNGAFFVNLGYRTALAVPYVRRSTTGPRVDVRICGCTDAAYPRKRRTGPLPFQSSLESDSAAPDPLSWLCGALAALCVSPQVQSLRTAIVIPL